MDFAFVNEQPGPCGKCNGSGTYRWGANHNGVMSKSGPCHSCKGTGKQTEADIKRNDYYNNHRVITLSNF